MPIANLQLRLARKTQPLSYPGVMVLSGASFTLPLQLPIDFRDANPTLQPPALLSADVSMAARATVPAAFSPLKAPEHYGEAGLPVPDIDFGDANPALQPPAFLSPGISMTFQATAPVDFSPSEAPEYHGEPVLAIPDTIHIATGLAEPGMEKPAVLKAPATLAPDSSMAPQATAPVDFSPPEAPEYHGESVLAIPDTFHLEVGWAEPGIETLALPDFVLPQLETLFSPVERPRLAGKAYSGAGAAAKCRHGASPTQCGICKQYRELVAKLQSQPQEPSRQLHTVGPRQSPAHSPTVDVFAQLWFVLQPPLLERINQPDVFPNGRELYEFQIAGVKWLVDKPQALLADEMGLGKTIQAIIAMRILFQRGELQKVLVVCPVSVAASWMKELGEWAPELRPLRVNAPAALRRDQWRTPAEVYVVSYATLANDLKDSRVSDAVFDLCIIDEAQNIKNPAADRSRAVKRLKTKYRWALTGTPLENSLDDTISIFQFLTPGVLERFWGLAQFRETIKPYTRRRTINEVELDLPPLTHQTFWLELTGRQRAAYNNTERSGVAEIKELGQSATRIHILSLISELKQVCNYYYHEESGRGYSCKLEFLEERLDELVANDEKALVFSQYPNVTLKKIQPRLNRFKPLLYEGSLTERAREDHIDRFQESEENRVMLMGVKSGGTGITLTRANHVFHFDHWWNPAVEDQASKRAHRIGQERPVFITSLYTCDTIEERIFNLLKYKRQLFREVFDNLSDEAVADRLSDEDLFGLFGLAAPQRPPARTPLPV